MLATRETIARALLLHIERLEKTQGRGPAAAGLMSRILATAAELGIHTVDLDRIRQEAAEIVSSKGKESSPDGEWD